MQTKQGGKLPSVLVIVGPTASGKTSLAIEIAKKYKGEIISADSRAIYKYIDIASAKPSQKERSDIKHWGLDLVGPECFSLSNSFTVVDFKLYAQNKIEDVLSRAKLPIVVGGSGLYIDALIYDYQFDGGIKDGVLSQVDLKRRHHLNQKTIAELQRYCDKHNIIQPGNYNNKRYLVRAIEKHEAGHTVVSTNRILDERYAVVGLTTERESLYNKIAQRAVDMIEQGVVNEYKKVAEMYHPESEALKSNAYLAIKKHPDDQDAQLKEMIRLDKKLVKKQLTWFKRNEHIVWVSPKNASQQIVNMFEM